MSDPISNFIVQLVNASVVQKKTVEVPCSKIKQAVTKVLADEGFVSSFEVFDKKIIISLAYDANGEAKIHGVARISKPSRRVYLGSTEIRPVKNGFGRIILTTPKGIMTGEGARKEKVGGEALFKIW